MFVNELKRRSPDCNGSCASIIVAYFTWANLWVWWLQSVCVSVRTCEAHHIVTHIPFTMLSLLEFILSFLMVSKRKITQRFKNEIYELTYMFVFLFIIRGDGSGVHTYTLIAEQLVVHTINIYNFNWLKLGRRWRRRVSVCRLHYYFEWLPFLLTFIYAFLAFGSMCIFLYN